MNKWRILLVKIKKRKKSMKNKKMKKWRILLKMKQIITKFYYYSNKYQRLKKHMNKKRFNKIFYNVNYKNK